MLFPLSMQINILIFSILAGVITGMLFDLYRIFRGFEDPNKVLTFIEDTLFWIFTSIVVFIFLLITNYAYIRVYVYGAIIIGIILYMVIISNIFIKFQYKFLTIISKIFRISINFIFYPFKIIFYNLKRKNK
ncbi:spore cortex biosynthesis protein YabQ [Clostridium sp. USBA 49]|jgi:spore cortex biosynthesis protein YabQ|uniref:spore cortex biosynthesis protein YabQ n=1 Tax=Clostridium TaxID=1485 RepID=UPI000999BF40|nr:MULTISPECIES: spore cortex biosynthesis protein YabQ [Clostridium]SKA78723.1 spore cortex biosynthesis protein YabQ [Clostridium sp. USBA 49]